MKVTYLLFRDDELMTQFFRETPAGTSFLALPVNEAREMGNPSSIQAEITPTAQDGD